MDLKNEKSGNYLFILILIFFIAISLLKIFITCYGLEQADKYNLFIDLLFVLSGAIMGIGVAIYKWIYKKINEDVEKKLKICETNINNESLQNRRLTEAQSFKNTGYMHFYLYKTYSDCNNKETENKAATDNLKKAIEFTNLAMSVVKDLDQKINEKLICIIKDNLAWFLREKWECIKKKRKENEFKEYLRENRKIYEGDRRSALDCIDYIINVDKKRTLLFTIEQHREIIDTYNEVGKTFFEIDKLLK